MGILDRFKKKKGPGGGHGIIPAGTRGVSSRMAKQFHEASAKMFWLMAALMFGIGLICLYWDTKLSHDTWGNLISRYIQTEGASALAWAASLAPSIIQLAWTSAFTSDPDMRAFAKQPWFLAITGVSVVIDFVADGYQFVLGGATWIEAFLLTVVLFYGLSEVGVDVFGAITIGTITNLVAEKFKRKPTAPSGPSRGSRSASPISRPVGPPTGMPLEVKLPE